MFASFGETELREDEASAGQRQDATESGSERNTPGERSARATRPEGQKHRRWMDYNEDYYTGGVGMVLTGNRTSSWTP